LTLSSETVTAITRSLATVNWVSNGPANSQVQYGTSTAYGLVSAQDTAQVTSHAVSLAGLSRNTTYHYRVKSQAATGAGVTTSADFMFATPNNGPASLPFTSTLLALNSVRVFPNPWRADHPTAGITFDQMTPNSTVKIFTISAHFVKSLAAPDGKVTWDLTNDAGNKVASGLYLYLVTDTHNGRVRGKLAVIR
jgi:hypothetical protein